jgi:hypothetical protein
LRIEVGQLNELPCGGIRLIFQAGDETLRQRIDSLARFGHFRKVRQTQLIRIARQLEVEAVVHAVVENLVEQFLDIDFRVPCYLRKCFGQK